MPSGSALRILDPDNGDTAVPRIADQFLAAPAGDTREAKIRRIYRHQPHTLKAAELRLLAGEIPQRRIVSLNFDLGRPVNDDLYRAFAPVPIGAALITARR